MKEEYKFTKEGDLFLTEVMGHKFAFRKWTWGEKNALSSECSSVDPISGLINFNSTHFNEQLVLKTVLVEHEGKYVPYTIEEIKKMDGQLGERLCRLTQSLNLVSNIEAQNL